MVIRPINSSLASAWEAIRKKLWPEGSEEHATEIRVFFNGCSTDPVEVLTAHNSSNSMVGLVELSIRLNVAGLEGKRTGYVEGLYVDPGLRGQGVARMHLTESRRWARKQGCAAFASDRADRVIIDRRFRSAA